MTISHHETAIPRAPNAVRFCKPSPPLFGDRYSVMIGRLLSHADVKKPTFNAHRKSTSFNDATSVSDKTPAFPTTQIRPIVVAPLHNRDSTFERSLEALYESGPIPRLVAAASANPPGVVDHRSQRWISSSPRPNKASIMR